MFNQVKIIDAVKNFKCFDAMLRFAYHFIKS